MAVAAPAGTVTEAGTETAELLDEMEMEVAAAAAPDKVTVQVLAEPGVTVAGAQ